MKKGFTLVELLAVIVLIALITSIGAAGISAAKKNINNNLWESTIKLIETGAVNYGEDNKNKLTGTCTIGEKVEQNCISVSVEFLINNNYIKTKETDESGKKVLVNKKFDKSEEGYYVNNKNVYIYLENNNIYATLEGE